MEEIRRRKIAKKKDSRKYSVHRTGNRSKHARIKIIFFLLLHQKTGTVELTEGKKGIRNEMK